MLDLLLRYFWAVVIVTNVVQLAAQWRRTGAIIDTARRQRCQRVLQWLAGCSTAPFVVMGLGILSGSTNSLFDFLYPRDGNAWVLAFHATIALGLGLVLWLVFSRNPPERLIECRDYVIFSSGTMSSAGFRLVVVVGLGGAAFALAMMWTELIPEIRDP